DNYEAWLRSRSEVIDADLAWKHAEMKRTPFAFLRATYYRWAQLWPELCEDEATMPDVLAIGDLHVENFGTWRDSEGRLIWGVNDFDEASRLPYGNDLVRLATSAALAIEAHALATSAKEACVAILEGYARGLELAGRPFVLAEEHPALLTMARERLKDPSKFWQKLLALPKLTAVPADIRAALASRMPTDTEAVEFCHRIAGLGSLGRQRFVAIADWKGGKIAREAKVLAPSACAWARVGKFSTRILYDDILAGAVRCPDPFVAVHGRWIVRRLAPDCSRIELGALPKQRDEVRLLQAMGRETANVHLGSARSEVLRKDLQSRPRGWLFSAATAMKAAMLRDWEEWR
ncbi:MAG: DUF2252 family protein, partial [Bryobacteraceae bacterium]